MNNLINVLVAYRNNEDRKDILSGLPEQDFFIVDMEKDEAGTIIRSERFKPDVLILDLYLSEMNNLELVRIIRRRSPSTAIVILCEKDEGNFACLAIKAGASGFLLKNEDIDKLALVAKIVFSGGCYISASITARVFGEVSFSNQFPGQITEQHHSVFSPVERGIVTDLANGLSDNQIAKHLNYSAGSIKNIVTAMKRRTKLKNRIQIVVFALVCGLLRFEHLWVWKETS
jgi:two-component system nitrate/nitrite response regulator NarL